MWSDYVLTGSLSNVNLSEEFKGSERAITEPGPVPHIFKVGRHNSAAKLSRHEIPILSLP